MRSGPSFVYFARHKANDMIKIGVTRDPARRAHQLQAVLLGTLPGDRDTEARLHWQFGAASMGREWFAPTPELVAMASAPTLDAVLVGPLPKGYVLPRAPRRCRHCRALDHVANRCPVELRRRAKEARDAALAALLGLPMSDALDVIARATRFFEETN